MNNENNFPIYETVTSKIDTVRESLHNRINEINDKCVKKSNLKDYYATKHYVWGLCAILGGVLCGAYWLVTPIIIKSENSSFKTQLDNIEKYIKELPKINSE